MPTINEFDVSALLHADTFPSRGVYMAARRGLRRLAEAAAASGAAVVDDPAAALSALRRAGAVDARSTGDEIPALRRLAILPAPDAGTTVRIARGEATLADAIACVRLRGDWGAEVGRIVGAVRRLAKVVGATPDGIPARRAHVDHLFARRRPADFGLRPRTYATFKSRIRRAVGLVDQEARTHLKASGLTGPWRRLREQAEALGQGRSRGWFRALWPLVRYCHARAIAPEDVTDDTLRALLAHLEERGVKGACDVARKVVYAWEGLQAAVPGWPAQQLSRIYAVPGRARSWPAFEDLPEHVQAIWHAYAAVACRRQLESYADLVPDLADEFADIGGGAEDPSEEGTLKASSLRCRRTIFTEAVEAAREIGIDVRTMADVANLDVSKRLLARIRARQEAAAEAAGVPYSPRNGYRKNAAVTMRMLALHAGASEAEMEEFARMRDRVDPYLVRVYKNPRTGLQKRHYARKQMGQRPAKALRQFRSSLTLHGFFGMPDRLLAAARPLLERPERAQEGRTLVISALCHLILREVPLRRGDLGRLRVSETRPRSSCRRGAGAAGRRSSWTRRRRESPSSGNSTSARRRFSAGGYARFGRASCVRSGRRRTTRTSFRRAVKSPIATRMC